VPPKIDWGIIKITNGREPSNAEIAPILFLTVK
jgi:hypothetical protein